MDLRMLLAAGTRLSLVAALTAQASALDLQHPCPSLALPFDMVSNFEVVVQGQIGELDGLKFILDTGSSHSVIDRRVADRIGLHRRPGKVFNFDRDLAIEWADVPMFGSADAHRERPHEGRQTRRDSEFADNVDGIIGLDVLSRPGRSASTTSEESFV